MTHSIITDLLYSATSNESKFLTYNIGNLPVVISAPHGGNIKPISIPSRKYGNRSRDTYTRRLTARVVELLAKTGNTPYYVYADIHRSRIDLNRDLGEATQGNEKMVQLWYKWNNVVRSYVSDAKRKYGNVLYIDIHSHNKNLEFQLGYGMSARGYVELLKTKDSPEPSTMDSIGYKANRYYPMFGKRSLFNGLKMGGFMVMEPRNENDYLNGGRNIREFSGNKVGAVQIECPIPVLESDLEDVAITLEKSILSFVAAYLNG